eukprot:TRINITY_DN2683_c0_g1_i1.p1 TRINITY_DN2683_c0_g1~~TRINITY_DN2683_c0_g1_i1.p1  ORF type:complete len:241 (+),score=76.77 TRINITY_DN2683_c0_g1_i1:89-724(+)
MPATLYYTAHSCGAASYISAFKAGLLGNKINAYQVDIREKKVLQGPNTGANFLTFNPKGNVPTLILEDGTLLNENAAVLQWIADQAAPGVLAPEYKTSARYLLLAKLSYVSSEVHQALGTFLFYPLDPATREFFQKKSAQKLAYLNDHELAGKTYLVGDSFTVVDAYLYIVLSWRGDKIDLTPYPNVQKFYDHIASLDFVKGAHAAIAESK